MPKKNIIETGIRHITFLESYESGSDVVQIANIGQISRIARLPGCSKFEKRFY